RVRHHVERLDRGGISGQEVDVVAFLGHALPEEFLPLRIDIVPVADPFAPATEDLERLSVCQALERNLWPRRRGLEELQLGLPVRLDPLDRLVHRALVARTPVLLAL